MPSGVPGSGIGWESRAAQSISELRGEEPFGLTGKKSSNPSRPRTFPGPFLGLLRQCVSDRRRKRTTNARFASSHKRIGNNSPR